MDEKTSIVFLIFLQILVGTCLSNKELIAPQLRINKLAGNIEILKDSNGALATINKLELGSKILDAVIVEPRKEILMILEKSQSIIKIPLNVFSSAENLLTAKRIPKKYKISTINTPLCLTHIDGEALVLTQEKTIERYDTEIGVLKEYQALAAPFDFLSCEIKKSKSPRELDVTLQDLESKHSLKLIFSSDSGAVPVESSFSLRSSHSKQHRMKRDSIYDLETQEEGLGMGATIGIILGVIIGIGVTIILFFICMKFGCCVVCIDPNCIQLCCQCICDGCEIANACGECCTCLCKIL